MGEKKRAAHTTCCIYYYARTHAVADKVPQVGVRIFILYIQYGNDIMIYRFIYSVHVVHTRAHFFSSSFTMIIIEIHRGGKSRVSRSFIRARDNKSSRDS